jgi:hypothetical protein
MAADVAADFKQATAVPEKVRMLFLIDDEIEMKRANATAVQWVIEQLEARQGQPVAVIVLWAAKPPAPPPPADLNDPLPTDPRPAPVAAAAYEPVFVLLRGEETDPHKFRINYAVYGNPVPEQE